KYSCSGSLLILTKGSTAIDGLSGSGSGCSAAPTRAPRASLPRTRGRVRVGAFRSHPVDPDGPCDVLEALLADVFEGEVEAARRILLDAGRDADAARLG